MSDYELKRINALTEASAINDSDVFAIDSAAGTKKVAWETLKGEVDADIAPIATAVEGIEESLTELVTTHENFLEDTVVLHEGYWKRSSPIDWSGASGYNAYAPIDIVEGKTYYFKHIFLYYSVVVYEGETSVVTLTSDTTQDMSGSFTPESNGKMYLTTNKTLPAPLFTDDIELYTASTVDTYYAPNKLIIPDANKNLMEDVNWEDGKYLNGSGALSSGTGYSTSGYVAVPNQLLSLTFIGQLFICFYNESMTFIGSRKILYFETSRTTQLPVPQNAVYIRISCATSNKTVTQLRSLPDNREYKFDVGQQSPYTSFTDCINDAVNYPNATVYVHAGTYDLLQEQGGSAYFDAYVHTTGNEGIHLGNNVHIKGSGDAVLQFLYTGSNADVGKYYSPLNALSGDCYGFTLENITIVASNCRYCVHDDRGNDLDDYTNKYINCVFDLDNSANSNGYPQCIGGGLGVSGNVAVRNCKFTSRYVSQAVTNSVASYHNSVNANAKSRVVFDGNYCDGGTLRFSYYGTSTKKTEVIACNNSVESAVIKAAENESATVDNVNLLAWNNEVRAV